MTEDLQSDVLPPSNGVPEPDAPPLAQSLPGTGSGIGADLGTAIVEAGPEAAGSTSAISAPLGPTVYCFACGAQIDARAEICPRCGVRQRPAPGSAPPQGGWTPPAGYGSQSSNTRNRTTAGIFAILLGGLGVHKFYLGKVGWGIVYLLFCWTFIPSIVGLIEGILYLTMSDEEFARRYG